MALVFRAALIMASLLFGTAALATDEDRSDLIAAARDGLRIYQGNCVNCHGVRADGKSRLARIMKTKPTNLRTSPLDALQMTEIIRQGGAAQGRSDAMPAWKNELSTREINHIVAYLRSINSTQ